VAGKYTVETTGPKIETFLQKMIQGSGLELNYRIGPGSEAFSNFETPDIIVKFRGPDVDMLLENKAELLLAMEQLTTEHLGMASDEHSLLCFDANDHRALRIEELRLSALTAAEKVKKTRVPFHFSPMNSRERRILHLALRNETDVRSESVGMAPHRQVVIVPADLKELPPPRIPPPPRFAAGSGGGDRDRGDRGERRGGGGGGGPRPPSGGGGRPPRRGVPGRGGDRRR
jgi:spoIIIJ-associated protein